MVLEQKNKVDAAIDAVAQIKKSIVKIKSKSNDKLIDGIGLIVSKDGIIVIDKAAISQVGDSMVVFPDGQEFPAQLLQVQKEGDIAFIIAQIPDDKKSKVAFNPITFAPSIKLGQSVATLYGKDIDVVSQGIIEKVGSDASSTSPQVTSITISTPSTKSMIGSPLFNIFGEVIGFKTTSLISADSNIFYPLGLIKPAIPVLRK